MDIVKLERISDMLHSQVESGAAVGCSAYVLRHGRPIYRATAAYGHFGRTDVDLPWERLDMVDALRAEAAAL